MDQLIVLYRDTQKENNLRPRSEFLENQRRCYCLTEQLNNQDFVR